MKANRRSKKQDTSSKLILEEIIGLTTKNANGLASNISTASCAYLAGCVVVIYNVDSGKQSHLMVSHRSPKPLRCVAVSQDGRFVAAGESGNQPAVLVWDCSTLTFVSELKDHLYGVECIAFSPDGEHLVSVGGYIYLWNWRSGMLVTKLKASSSCSAVTSVSFSADAKFVITAGKKHLKFWAVGSSPGSCLNKGTLSLTIHGKPVNLGPQKGSSFTSVASAISVTLNSKQAIDLFPIYALTDEGVLCLVDCALSIRKSVDLKVEKGFALSASAKLVACACCNGIVQLFMSETLNYAGSLLYSRAKICREQAAIVYSSSTMEKDFQPGLPDAVACQFSTSEKLVVVYEDHSLHVWDIHDTNKATRCYVLVSHSACIWDVKNLCCENMHDPSVACVARGCSGGVSFATCSADGTIRLWDLALQLDLVDDDSGHNFLNTESAVTAHLASSGVFERDIMEASTSTQGFRSMAASADGKYLAVGDCEGNLHIYNLHTSDYTCFKGVHDTEILSLSFSLSSNKCDISEEVVDDNYFLASGGRDRIIHLYDVKRNFDLIESIDDHSAAVTSVKLTCRDCKILSCSADRSLVFRDVSMTDSGHKILRRHHQIASHGTVYDMALDPTTEFVVTVGQDKKINAFNIASGKPIRSFKQDKDFGDPIKVTMDPSGSYLVCSYSNKSMCMYDSISGEMVVQVMGHGEVITGVIFLPDCKHVISVGGDGCIFVWKLPARISSRMLQRIKENSRPLSSKNSVLTSAFNRIIISEEEDQLCRINPEDDLFPESNQVVQNMLDKVGGPRRTPTFRFSISRLPMWAQAKVAHSDILLNPDFTSSQPQQQLEEKSLSPMASDGREYGPFYHEAQTPVSLDVRGNASCLSSLSRTSPDTNSSQISPISQENLKYFAKDNHWLSIYTVCLDVLNSPETHLSTNLKMPVLSSHLLQNPAKLPRDGEFPLEQAFIVRSDGYKVPKRYACSGRCENLDNHDHGFGLHNTSTCQCHRLVSTHMAEQLSTDKSRSQMRKPIRGDCCHLKSEDNELFKQNFGSLSTSCCKVERSRSSVRRRYSARYILQRDYHGDCKRLFDTPDREGGKTLKYGGETVPHNTSENLEEVQQESSCKQGVKSSVQISNLSRSQNEWTKFSQAENSLHMKLRETMDQKEITQEESNFQQRTIACREALLHLDEAAKNVLNLFAELGATLVSKDDISSGPEAELYDEAGKLLPSIAEKLDAVAELVQCRNNYSCRSRAEVSGFKPLLETFAENLSKRVMEMVEKNLNKD
ncbi:mitogen-activated protein kinase-binding protein 1 [Jatropha curcas]|uniref:mitogen-activated protein kinase-binding protein 1 n=1 Tax=Jatropha curcas TaxID=180498 RepID=UPI0005FAE2A8|nr:mitogen-activated protein kinase-binding protein 1 [Jatropha curcas]